MGARLNKEFPDWVIWLGWKELYGTFRFVGY